MELFGLNPTLFWFILGVIFLVMEVLVPGFFLLFFGLGAWVTAALLFFVPISLSLQLSVFILVTVISLIVLRRKIKDILKRNPSQVKTMDDPIFANQYLNREVLVLKEVGPNNPGLVELNGTNWQAHSKSSTIPAGGVARVMSMEGLTLLVESSESTK